MLICYFFFILFFMELNRPNFSKVCVDCCKQCLKQLLHPPIHPSIFTFFADLTLTLLFYFYSNVQLFPPFISTRLFNFYTNAQLFFMEKFYFSIFVVHLNGVKTVFIEPLYKFIKIEHFKTQNKTAM